MDGHDQTLYTPNSFPMVVLSENYGFRVLSSRYNCGGMSFRSDDGRCTSHVAKLLLLTNSNCKIHSRRKYKAIIQGTLAQSVYSPTTGAQQICLVVLAV